MWLSPEATLNAAICINNNVQHARSKSKWLVNWTAVVLSQQPPLVRITPTEMGLQKFCFRQHVMISFKPCVSRKGKNSLITALILLLTLYTAICINNNLLKFLPNHIKKFNLWQPVNVLLQKFNTARLFTECSVIAHCHCFGHFKFELFTASNKSLFGSGYCFCG